MLEKHDAKSVQQWAQENCTWIFYYQETGPLVPKGLTPSTIPFTVGIQTPWQLEMMVLFGHKEAVSIDATFGTNQKKVRVESCLSRCVCVYFSFIVV